MQGFLHNFKKMPPCKIGLGMISIILLGFGGYLLYRQFKNNVLESFQPSEKNNNNEVDSFMYQQLIKRIDKLTKINEENVQYYKNLNREQQTILLDIIEKRNSEIDKLRKMLTIIKDRLTPMVEQQEKINVEKPIVAETMIESMTQTTEDNSEDADILKHVAKPAEMRSSTPKYEEPEDNDIKLTEKKMLQIPVVEKKVEFKGKPCLETYGYDTYKYFCQDNCKKSHEMYSITKTDDAKPPNARYSLSSIKPGSYTKVLIEPPKPYDNKIYEY